MFRRAPNNGKTSLSTSTLWQKWQRFNIKELRLFIRGRHHEFERLFIIWMLLLIAAYSWYAVRKLRMRTDDSRLWKDIDFWRGRHFIFCLSPGRGGTKHLRNVLDVGYNVRAFHEPPPTMTGSILSDTILHGRRHETFASRASDKLSAIREQLEGTVADVVYAETSHMFVKTFADVVLHTLGEIANISIIYLHRPMVQIVTSQVRLGWFAKNHSGFGRWYYDVSDVHASERVLNLTTFKSTAQYKNKKDDSIDKAIAYVTDVRLRSNAACAQVKQMHMAGRWKGVQIFHVEVSRLKSMGDINRFLHTLGIDADPSRLQLLPLQDDNEREIKKDRVALEVSSDEVAYRINVFLNQFPTLGDKFQNDFNVS